LLLIGYQRSSEIYAFLEKRAVPSVVAWSYEPGATHPAIGFDNTGAMAALARRVLRLGHRHIGMLSAATASNDRARGRVNGVLRAMAEAGVPEDDFVLVETQYAIEAGETAFRRVMARAPATSAVLCGNDVLAIGALRAARKMGLRVPKDISITGFDDIELATLAEPGLTTVHVPHREMGRRAAEMLVRMVKERTPADSIELPAHIRLRQSLGPAPPPR
ncbi:MAG: substrate-binding domain-containing protein, partial [Pseudomonadota bacterium]